MKLSLKDRIVSLYAGVSDTPIRVWHEFNKHYQIANDCSEAEKIAQKIELFTFYGDAVQLALWKQNLAIHQATKANGYNLYYPCVGYLVKDKGIDCEDAATDLGREIVESIGKDAAEKKAHEFYSGVVSELQRRSIVQEDTELLLAITYKRYIAAAADAVLNGNDAGLADAEQPFLNWQKTQNYNLHIANNFAYASDESFFTIVSALQSEQPKDVLAMPILEFYSLLKFIEKKYEGRDR